MSGKRGRASALRENNYGSSGSFDKYFNSRHNKKPTLKNKSKDNGSSSAINKEKVREGLNENKKYESINKLSKRGGEWDSVYKKSEKSGISTKKLEIVSRKLGNSHVINEYGFKPHVKVVTSQYNDLKQKGYLPNTHIKEFGVIASSPNVKGNYNPKNKSYNININSLGLPSIERSMRTGKLAGTTFKDVITHELGHAVYFQNKVGRKYTLVNGKKKALKFSNKETQIRGAYARMLRDLRKQMKSGSTKSLSSYAYSHNKAIKKGKTKIDRQKARKRAYHETFAEGYVNYVNYSKGKTSTLHPTGKIVGRFIKTLNSL